MDKDLRNTALYIINGIICDMWDYFKSEPTVEMVRENFNFPKYYKVTDQEIVNIIISVRRYM